jgi:hypothetical protein
MPNPFAKKNPWLSVWLSAANAWAGTARGLVAAEARRQQTALTKAATRTTPRKRRRRKAG